MFHLPSFFAQDFFVPSSSNTDDALLASHSCKVVHGATGGRRFAYTISDTGDFACAVLCRHSFLEPAIVNINKFYDQASVWLISFGPKLLLALVILFAGIWLIRILSKALTYTLVKRRIDPSLRPFLISSVLLILRILLVLAIMQVLGIQLTVFAAIIGAFGVAAGLALSGTLQNFTSGILILLLKPFRVGDNIIAQGSEGTVTMIRIFYTVVTTFDNRTVIIPNSKLSNEVIVNLSRQGNRRLDIELKFDFNIPFESVKTILEQTVNNHKDLLKDPSFRIGVSTIEADGYKVMVNVWVKAHGYQDIKLQLQEVIIDNIIKGGIKLKGM